MLRRRAVCTGLALLFGGCVSNADPPRTWESPKIEGEYLPERNAVRLWNAATEPFTSPRKMWVTVHPSEQSNNDSEEAPAIIETEGGSNQQGLWVAPDENGVTESPLRPDDTIIVSGYRRSRSVRELTAGDQIGLRVEFEELQGLQHYTLLGVPGEPSEQ